MQTIKRLYNYDYMQAIVLLSINTSIINIKYCFIYVILFVFKYKYFIGLIIELY